MKYAVTLLTLYYLIIYFKGSKGEVRDGELRWDPGVFLNKEEFNNKKN